MESVLLDTTVHSDNFPYIVDVVARVLNG